MPVTVPSTAEFDKLTARVTALEQAKPPQPIPPNPNPSPGTGKQAKRVADGLIELFGVNTFSSLDQNNVWGSYPADYRPGTVVDALKYLTSSTAFRLRLREYHYDNRTDMQRQWLTQVLNSLPNTKVTMCVGASGSQADVPSLISLAADPHCGINWIEGLNEPNTDFGWGTTPVDRTMAIQRDCFHSGKPTMGPSVVAGMPHPEGWITGYFGGSMAEVNSLLHWGNGHYYPPHCPDLTGDGTSIQEYVGGLWEAYGHHPIMLTEFHPSLYNNQGHGPGQKSAHTEFVEAEAHAVASQTDATLAAPGWDGARDAYYTLLTLFRTALCGVTGVWWYALFDYGSTYQCGLFPVNATNPRPAANAIRNLCKLCSDSGNLRTFTPGKLDVAVHGLTDRCGWDLYQRSDGLFYITLWQSANEQDGAQPISTTLEFGQTVNVSEWDVVTDTLVQHADSVKSYTTALPARARLLMVKAH
jgi:hypothetical protein